MRSLPSGRRVLAIGVLFASVLSVSAAPAPRSAAAPIDKYLLDDTDFLLVVEVKPLLAAPLVAKQYRKQIEELLKFEPVQVWLKDAGFDPLRDVERIIFVSSRRCHGTENDRLQASGPVVLLQGRFDGAKLRAKMVQLAKDSPQGIKVEAQGEIYRLKLPTEPIPFFFAQLNRATLVLSIQKELVAETLEKAAGKKKTALKSEAVREFLKQRKPELALQIVADGSAVWLSESRSQIQNGVRVTSVHHTTLEDMGILRIQGGLSVAEKIKGNLTLKTKDGVTAKQTAEIIRMGAKQVGNEFEAKVKAIAQNRGENLERAKKRDLAPLRKAVDDTTVEADGASVTLTTEIDGEGIATFLRVFFGIGMER